MLLEPNTSGEGQSVLIDKMESISYSEQISVNPIYGIGQNEFNFVGEGKALVSGMLVVRFVHQDYMLNAIKAVQAGQATSNIGDRDAFLSGDISTARTISNNRNIGATLRRSKLLNFPYF